MAEIVYSNPVDIVSFSIIGMFDSFRDRSNFPDQENTLQIVLLVVSLYKDGVITDTTFNDKFSLLHLKELIGESALDVVSKKTYLSVIEIFSNSLSCFFDGQLSYFSFLMSNIKKELLINHFGDVFDDIIYKFSNAQGRTGGEFIQPLELTRLMLALADLKKEDNIYNPFAGLASFGILLNEKQSYYGQELNVNLWALGMLRLMAHKKLTESKFVNNDSILKWPDNSEKFDLIISSPPFGVRLENQYSDFAPNFRTIEQFFIEKGIQSLKENGKLIALLPQGSLFRGMHDQRLRKQLIEEDLIDIVVSFPSGMLLNTGINIAIIVLNKVKHFKGKIKFVDASAFINKKTKNSFEFKSDELLSLILSNKQSAHVKLVENAAVSENSYNLSVSQYFLDFEYRVKLGDLIERNRPFTRVLHGKEITLKRINFSDLNNNIKLDARELSIDIVKKNDFILDKSCFLLGTFNGKLKFTYFEFNDESYCCSGNLIPLRINEEKATISYFAKQLTESYFVEQFVGVSKGAAIQKVSKADLLNIILSVPHLEEQKRQRETILRYFENTHKDLNLLSL